MGTKMTMVKMGKVTTGGMKMTMVKMLKATTGGTKTTMAITAMMKKKTKMNTVATKPTIGGTKTITAKTMATTGGMKTITAKTMAKKTGGKTNTATMARMTRTKTMAKTQTTGGTEIIRRYP